MLINLVILKTDIWKCCVAFWFCVASTLRSLVFTATVVDVIWLCSTAAVWMQWELFQGVNGHNLVLFLPLFPFSLTCEAVMWSAVHLCLTDAIITCFCANSELTQENARSLSTRFVSNRHCHPFRACVLDLGQWVGAVVYLWFLHVPTSSLSVSMSALVCGRVSQGQGSLGTVMNSDMFNQI